MKSEEQSATTSTPPTQSYQPTQWASGRMFLFSSSFVYNHNKTSNGYRPRTPTTVPISSIVKKNKYLSHFIFESLKILLFVNIGHLHISIIHILRIHIIHKQHMQLITLIQLNHQQREQQRQRRPQRQQPQVKLLNHKHLHLLNNEWILLAVISPHLTMLWEVLEWIYEFRPFVSPLHEFSFNSSL